MPEPQRLTEAEWVQRTAARECARYGHEWQVVATLARPVALVCGRPCGSPGYTVTARPAHADPPEAPR
ncbi:putative endonuclease [Pseudanabaena phage Pam4]|nr:putative endonuclease [Pseudanabaena phage Pam4]